MLHVLLLLLKILGILLLLIIGLFLLVLLTPICYSFELEKEEQTEPKFAVRVTWLFWIFYFKTSYIEKVFDYQVRILGHQIAGNQPEFLKKQKERQKRKAENKKQNKNPVSKLKQEDVVSKEESSDTLKIKEKANDEIKVKKEDAELKGQKKDNKETKENNEKKDKKPKKESPFKKIKGRIKSLKETKANLDKLPWREWIELGKDILLRFLKHVLPRKLEGNVAFGLGDPEYTGYITGIAALFYPKYGEHFSLYPDFERKIFEAKCKGRGRIRPGYMLVLVVSILKEKSVRTMIKNIILG